MAVVPVKIGGLSWQFQQNSSFIRERPQRLQVFNKKGKSAIQFTQRGRTLRSPHRKQVCGSSHCATVLKITRTSLYRLV
jgi:hypothetical protein